MSLSYSLVGRTIRFERRLSSSLINIPCIAAVETRRLRGLRAGRRLTLGLGLLPAILVIGSRYGKTRNAVTGAESG